MITLSIDTSTDSLLVALFKDDVLLSNTYIESNKEHSKNAITEIEKLFLNNNINPKSISKIMVINGPGSFTGIRIGVTIAKVYAWACNINVIPISTLKGMAISNTGFDYYVSILDARRDYVYAGIYDKEYNSYMNDLYISKDELIKNISNLSNVLVIGDTSINKYDVIKNKLDAVKIYNYYKDESGINPHMLNPDYLKKTEAEEKIGG